MDYEGLLRAARSAEELEQEERRSTNAISKPQGSKVKQHASSQVHTAKVSDYASLEKKIDELVARISTLEKSVGVVGASPQAVPSSDISVGYCYECGNPDHYRNERPKKARSQKSKHQKQTGFCS